MGLGLSGVVPTLHFVISEGLIKATTMGQMGWLLLMATLYITGACLYAARIPERFFPGKCDIWVSDKRTHTCSEQNNPKVGALSSPHRHRLSQLIYSFLSLSLRLSLVPLPPAVPHLGGRGGFRSFPRRLQPPGVSLHGGRGLHRGRRPLTLAHTDSLAHPHIFPGESPVLITHTERTHDVHTCSSPRLKTEAACLVCVMHRMSTQGALWQMTDEGLCSHSVPLVCPSIQTPSGSVEHKTTSKTECFLKQFLRLLPLQEASPFVSEGGDEAFKASVHFLLTFFCGEL